MHCILLAAGEQVWGVYGWKQVNAPRQEFPVAAARCVGAPLFPPLLHISSFWGFWFLYFLFSPYFLYFQMGVAPSPTHFRQIKF